MTLPYSLDTNELSGFPWNGDKTETHSPTFTGSVMYPRLICTETFHVHITKNFQNSLATEEVRAGFCFTSAASLVWGHDLGVSHSPLGQSQDFTGFGFLGDLFIYLF